MPSYHTADFLAGVIEGFYGQPWSQAERLQLLDWMTGWALNTYFYAPKDDLKHRAAWRELYAPPELETVRDLIMACQQHNIRFIYALSPGLDIRYSSDAELDHLKKRFEQLLGSGCQHFSLLFDDIPDHLEVHDFKRWGSLASAQCHVANAIFKWTRERSPEARFLFCPTAYCGRMAARKLGGEGYLSTIGRKLLPDIDVFWTGPDIVSKEITVAHINEVQTLLRRKPLIWDNLHANDYDGRRFFCGPYAGRPLELRSAVRGLLSNPNNEFPFNYVPLRTLAEFVQCQTAWDPRKAYLAAIREWLPRFETIREPITAEDLILLGDCYYLPYNEGPEAEVLYQSAKAALQANPAESAVQTAEFREKAIRLRNICARLTELRDRSLFYALSRRIWDLREELDLLLRYVAFKCDSKHPGNPTGDDLDMASTFGGGMVPRLQRLLIHHYQPAISLT
jgi:protein O-GlcNAcase/histone acetyltransferase